MHMGIEAMALIGLVCLLGTLADHYHRTSCNNKMICDFDRGVVGVTSSQTQMTTITLFNERRTWEDSREFCSTLYMELLEVRNTIKATALDSIYTSTDVWKNQFQDSWIGLHYTGSPTGSGYSWAEDSEPLGTLDDWDLNEPLNKENDKCVKIVWRQSSFAWRTSRCNQKHMVFCESVGGDCIFDQHMRTPVNDNEWRVVNMENITSVELCKKECLTYTYDSKECWGVTFDSNCFLYVGTHQLQIGDVSTSPFYIKKCFEATTPDAINIQDTTNTPATTNTASTPDTTNTEDTTSTPDTTNTHDITSTPDTTSTQDTTSTPDTTNTQDTTSTPETTNTQDSTSAQKTTNTADITITPDTTNTNLQFTDSPQDTTSTQNTTITPDTTNTASTPDTTSTQNSTSTPDTASPPDTTSTPDTTNTTNTLVTDNAPYTVNSRDSASPPDTDNIPDTKSTQDSNTIPDTTNTPDIDITPTDLHSGTATTASPGTTATAAANTSAVNTIVDAPSRRRFRQCSCNSGLSNKTFKEKIKKIISDLIIDKEQTSKRIRKKTSAYDNRLSAQSIGAIGITLLIATGVLFLLADASYCLNRI